ncbi:MAG: general secretion pathway protein GspB [Steroidobacteraceae bacterium]
MSFILDALKKSEHDRQRNAGPALLEVRVAQPRPRLPVWAWVLGGLLLVNLLFVSWYLWRRSALPAEPGTMNSTVAGNTAAAAARPGAASSPGVAPAPGAAPALTNAAAPALAPPAAPAARDPYNAPLIEEPTLDGGLPPYESPADFAPAQNDVGVGYPPPPGVAGAGTVRRDSESYEDAIAQDGSLPALHLDLHAYAPDPAARFVFINMQKYQEGAVTKEGVTVERITPTGAELAYRGRRFVLVRE